MSDAPESISNRLVDVGHALEKTGKLGLSTAMGTIVSMRDKLDNDVKAVTHGKGVADVVMTAITQNPANGRLHGIASAAVAGSETLERDIAKGVARVPDSLVTAFKGLSKKADEVIHNDGQLMQVLAAASASLEAKTQNAMSQVSGIMSGLVSGGNTVSTHSGPATSVAANNGKGGNSPTT